MGSLKEYTSLHREPMKKTSNNHHDPLFKAIAVFQKSCSLHFYLAFHCLFFSILFLSFTELNQYEFPKNIARRCNLCGLS